MILGINIASGTPFFGLVADTGEYVSEPARLLVPDNTPRPHALLEFQESLRQQLRELDLQGLVLVRLRRHNNWIYSQAFDRASVVAIMMAEAARAEIKFRSETPQAIAGHLGCHVGEISDAMAGLVPATQEFRLYWTHRAQAFAAAHYVQNSAVA